LKGSLQGDRVIWTEFSQSTGAKTGEVSAQTYGNGNFLTAELFIDETRTEAEESLDGFKVTDGGSSSPPSPIGWRMEDLADTMSQDSRGAEKSFASRTASPKMQSSVAKEFLAQKRWDDLQQMLRWERSEFYDKVVRCDMSDVLGRIDEEEIKELISYSSPPPLMRMVLSNIFILLGLPDDWQSIKKHLRNFQPFLQLLQAFQYSSITLKQLQYMRRRLKKCPAAFNPDVVQNNSSACSAFCRWVNVMCWRAGEQNWFHADVEMLKDLDKESLSCLASFARPPTLVAAVLGNVQCLLGLDDDWPRIQSQLKSPSAFLQRLQYFDQTAVNGAIREAMRLRQKLHPHSFRPETVMTVSAPCALLSKWVNSVCLRAGLDTSKVTAGPRGKAAVAGCYAYQRDESPQTPRAESSSPRQMVKSNLEEMPGWSERIPIESKFIRPEEGVPGQSLDRMLTTRRLGSASPQRWQARIVKTLMESTGGSGNTYPFSRTKSPLQKREKHEETATSSPRESFKPGLVGGSPRASSRQRPSVHRIAKATSLAASPRAQSHRNAKAEVAARQASLSPATRALSPAQRATADKHEAKATTGAVTGGMVSPTALPTDDSAARHPDAGLLSSLQGPAVITVVAGVLRSPPKNPEQVAAVLGNVHCILGLNPSWESVLESLNSFEQFMGKLRYLDQVSITKAQLEQLEKRRKENPSSFDPNQLVQVSHACAKFATWVNAVCHRAGLPY
jgi:hypothetical protein